MKELLKTAGGRTLAVGVIVLLVAAFAYMQPISNRFGTDCGNLLDQSNSASYADSAAELKYYEARARGESPAFVSGNEQEEACDAARSSRGTPVRLGILAGGLVAITGAAILIRRRTVVSA